MLEITFDRDFHTASSAGMLLEDSGKVLIALTQKENNLPEFSFRVKLAVYDSVTNDDSLQLRMKQLTDSYGLAGAMARGRGADSGNIYVGGSYLAETETSPTPKWYLAYFRI